MKKSILIIPLTLILILLTGCTNSTTNISNKSSKYMDLYYQVSNQDNNNYVFKNHNFDNHNDTYYLPLTDSEKLVVKQSQQQMTKPKSQIIQAVKNNENKQINFEKHMPIRQLNQLQNRTNANKINKAFIENNYNKYKQVDKNTPISMKNGAFTNHNRANDYRKIMEVRAEVNGQNDLKELKDDHNKADNFVIRENTTLNSKQRQKFFQIFNDYEQLKDASLAINHNTNDKNFKLSIPNLSSNTIHFLNSGINKNNYKYIPSISREESKLAEDYKIDKSVKRINKSGKAYDDKFINLSLHNDKKLIKELNIKINK